MCRWCCWYAGRAPFMRSGDSSRSAAFAALSGSECPLTLLAALLVPGMARSLSLFSVLLLVFVGDSFPLCGGSPWVEEPPPPPPPLFTTSTMGEAAAISTSIQLSNCGWISVCQLCFLYPEEVFAYYTRSLYLNTTIDDRYFPSMTVFTITTASYSVLR